MIESIRHTMQVEFETNLRMEREKWETRLEQMNREHQDAMEQLKTKDRVKDTASQQVIFNEAMKKVVMEKDRQVDQVREELKEAEERASKAEAEVREERQRLEAEVKRWKKKAEEVMSTSVMPVAQDNNANSGGSGGGGSKKLREENARLKSMLSNSVHADLSRGELTTETCNVGDRVMVAWSEPHNNFVIVQEGAGHLMHFLHADSHEVMGLAERDEATGRPRVQFARAEVVHKEFCQAKKPTNRFRMPQGSQFHRVKCKPVEKK